MRESRQCLPRPVSDKEARARSARSRRRGSLTRRKSDYESAILNEEKGVKGKISTEAEAEHQPERSHRCRASQILNVWQGQSFAPRRIIGFTTTCNVGVVESSRTPWLQSTCTSTLSEVSDRVTNVNTLQTKINQITYASAAAPKHHNRAK